MTGLAKFFAAGALIAGLSGLAAAPALADTAKPAGSTANCFSARDWEGWSSPSPSVILIRVSGRSIYRLDLAGGSSDLSWPDEHLVTKFRGSDFVCGPMDFDLYVSDGQGMREGLIVKAITKLTPEEVAAIPPKFRP